MRCVLVASVTSFISLKIFLKASFKINLLSHSPIRCFCRFYHDYFVVCFNISTIISALVAMAFPRSPR